MTVMLVYCDDPSHTADPIGPYITDLGPAIQGQSGKALGHSWPVVADDVYIAGEFSRYGVRWRNLYRGRVTRRVGNRRVGHRLLGRDGQERQLLEDGTVLPPPAYDAEDLLEETRGKWAPRCRAKTRDGRVCGQRGGRWKTDDRDQMFTRLAERGITGVSLRTLDTIKHTPA